MIWTQIDFAEIHSDKLPLELENFDHQDMSSERYTSKLLHWAIHGHLVLTTKMRNCVCLDGMLTMHTVEDKKLVETMNIWNALIFLKWELT